MLDIAQCFRYPTTGPDRFVFTMNIKSLYTVIPNNDGLLALRHFLNKRPVQEPPSHILVCLAELVLTLNSFSFNGDYFQQTGGVAMGSRLGPNCACLFVGHVEEQIFQLYPGKKPDLYKRYIDYIAGAASCSKNELDNFGEFINNFHPSLKFTWAISDNQLPFLDLLLKPIPQGLTTSIHYKETDSHSYLTYKSSHPVRYKNSVPYSQFPRLKRICSDENDYKTKGKEMASFFLQRDYPLAVVDRALQHVHTIPRDTALRPPNDGQSNKEVIPLILTYNPINHHVKNILSRNFDLLKSDSETKELFDNSWVLGAYRRNTNLRDSWVSSNLQSGANTEDEPNGTFPCRRPRCKTCAHTNPASQINTPGGPLTIRQRFSCTTSNLVYIITCRACTLSYVGEIGRRLGDRFCEHLRSVSKKADLPVAKHFSSPGRTTDDMMVAVVRAGLHNTRDRHRAECRLIFKCKTLQPRGINIDFNFIWVNSSSALQMLPHLNKMTRVQCNGIFHWWRDSSPETSGFSNILALRTQRQILIVINLSALHSS